MSCRCSRICPRRRADTIKDSHTMPSDTKMQELLTALTEAVIAEDNNLDAIVDYYEDIPRKEANGLLHLIRRLHKAYVVVQPSQAFSRRLKQDLIGVPRKNLIWRWRSLPPTGSRRASASAGAAVRASTTRRASRSSMPRSSTTAPARQTRPRCRRSARRCSGCTGAMTRA